MDAHTTVSIVWAILTLASLAFLVLCEVASELDGMASDETTPALDAGRAPISPPVQCAPKLPLHVELALWWGIRASLAPTTPGGRAPVRCAPIVWVGSATGAALPMPTAAVCGVSSPLYLGPGSGYVEPPRSHYLQIVG